MTSDESSRASFLRAFAAEPHNATHHLIYSDWLDERGEHEEADRHRRWPASHDWLVAFCEENKRDDDDLTYDVLVSVATEAAADGTFAIECGNNETVCNALRTAKGEFWRHWSVVTGVAVPDGESGSYHCGC